METLSNLFLSALLIWPFLAVLETGVLLVSMITTDYFPQKKPGKVTRFFFYLIGAPLVFAEKELSVFGFLKQPGSRREIWLLTGLNLANCFFQALLIAGLLGSPGWPLVETGFEYLFKFLILWGAATVLRFIWTVVKMGFRRVAYKERFRVDLELLVEVALTSLVWITVLFVLYTAADYFFDI